MAHDFKNFPELTNSQMQIYYVESPHKQITEDFRARVVRVSDGDTVRLKADFRDFNFPLRISKLAAPELNERGGVESQKWLEGEILNKEVDIILSRARVEKWGRLLGGIISNGMDIAELSTITGHGVAWEDRETSGQVPNFSREIEGFKP